MPAKNARDDSHAEAVPLTWEQVSAWRMAHQHLLGDPAPSAPAVAEALCGVHGQVLTSAEYAIRARTEGVGPDDVRAALWTGRSLVKAWAMRGTLHFFAAEDWPLYVAALRARNDTRRPAWYRYFNVTQEELDALSEGIRAALDGRTLTREELAGEVARVTGRHDLEEMLKSGWGTFLKPASYNGYLCFGPNRGTNATFTRPDQWLAGWREYDSGEAQREILRRYLRTYGPTTRDEFARWFGVVPGDVRALFEGMKAEMEPVSVEGWKAWAIAGTAAEMREAGFGRGPHVRLLHGFDPYVVAVALPRPQLLDPVYKPLVYRTGAWVSFTVVVNGRVEGVWETETKRGRATVSVKMFTPAGRAVKRGIEAEGARLERLLNAPVDLVFQEEAAA